MKRSAFLWPLIGLVLLTGCDETISPDSAPGAPSVASPGDLGATPGGVQDMRSARELVANGMVPPPAALNVEGMFSEHDLPVTGDACASALCIRGALGWQDETGWLQLGLSSDIDPESFVRPASGLVLLVDVSGSMGWDYGRYGVPATIARQLLFGVLEHFNGADRIGIATFATDAALVQEFVPGDRHDLLRSHVERLAPGGSTNMEAGLRLAKLMFDRAELDLEQRRVLLITDANPNTGATSPGSFMAQAAALAEEGIGLTVIGVGLGLDPTVMQAMLDLEGGNGFSIASPERVASFLDDHWPWMIHPIAYQLRVLVLPAAGFQVDRGYGFPGDEHGLEVATVFLSQRRGALLVELTGGAFTELGASLELSYRTRQGEPRQESLSLGLPAGAELDDGGRYFEEYSTEKTTVLAQLVADMRGSAELYGDQPEEAVGVMEVAHARFAADAEALLAQGQGDAADIERELALSARMLELMRERAPQGTLYGQWP